MFGSTPAYSSFSVDDLDAARAFYGDTLGLQVGEEGTGDMRMLFLTLAGGAKVLVYPKGDQHAPASFTVLNFPVDDIDAAVAALKDKGVEFQRYPGFDADDQGVVRNTGGDGPTAIAWFTDPAKNVLAVLQE
ncbi:VOC family protein [Streptomyces sp. NPDC006339]|uniref:VOC family protein n=1 Tax=Streptomyces sp. NPDC006339 TaxID=3156755 RepID=UPI0033AE5E23